MLLSEIADTFLSNNDDLVIAKKRKNFKNAIVKAFQEYPKDFGIKFVNSISEQIVRKTFDEGIVN